MFITIEFCCKPWKFRCISFSAGDSVLVVMVSEGTHLWRIVVESRIGFLNFIDLLVGGDTSPIN
jgi:hypothetical protein